MALPAYRHLIRSITLAFRDDTRLLTSALSTARSNFESSRILPPADAAGKVAHAEEVAKVLRRNIVQGRRSEAREGGERFQLRIHEDTERGSNETIKSAGQALMGGGGMGGGCCGGGAAATPGPAA